ncbi:MAG: hypothetical protein RL494_269 [Bacteroidota bacterium]
MHSKLIPLSRKPFFNTKSFLVIVFLLLIFKSFGQQQTNITVVLDEAHRTFHVKQTILVTNNSTKSLTTLVLNDWNHAYSDKYSPLGKRFSDEYVRNFHLAPEKERGNTTITKMTVNDSIATWNRVQNQLDLIEVPLKISLEPNKSVTIALEYTLKIPDARFTRLGYDDGNYYLKNCFLSLARFSNEGQFVYYSNENLEDMANATYNAIAIDFTIPKNIEITCNLDLVAQTDLETTKNIQFSGKNRTEIQLAIEKKDSYESFKNEQIEVVTNLEKSRLNDIQRAIVIDKVVHYVSENLGELAEKKIMISQVDYERSPFYGLNQLPAFLSPFPDEFMYEVKFLKVYLYNYLKSALQLDQRKDSYLYDAIQVYLMMKYTDENYPQLKLFGNLSRYKLLKSYHLVNSNFNDQYNYLYLLMARDNLDQNIGNSKVTFIRFNEQISGKYKAGLSFKYLSSFLKDDTVENSFKEFIVLNKEKQTNSSDFEFILKKNSKQNIDYFFPNLIHSRNTIDYKFGKVSKTKDSISVTIKNNSNGIVPVSLSLLRKKEVLSKQWISNIKTDTTFIINRSNADKLVLNYNNEIPEYNLRNNFKSLKGFFSLNRPIKFNFLKDVEEPKYTQIFYVPEATYNLYDGMIASISFHNKAFYDKPFVYDISPSFSTKTGSVTGSFGISYRQLFRDQKLYGITYGLSSSYYHYIQNAAYLKINPSILFKFRETDFRKNKRQYLLLRTIIVDKDKIPSTVNASPELKNSPLNYSVFDAKYTYHNAEMAKGMAFGTDFQLAGNFGKLAAEVSYRKLFENNYQFSVRVFAGSFLYKNTNSDFYNFGLDRPKDYLFDYNYYGRSETTGLFSQQIIIAEGGFKSKFKNPYANQWMTTLNATSSVWQWIELYGDAGFYQNKGHNTQFVYDSGVHLNLVPNYFELYFPVYSSNGFEMGQKNYQEKIRFIITLNPKTLIGLFTRKWF